MSLDGGTARATELALQILERQEEFPGVTAQLQALRDYPQPEGVQAAQVLGHVQGIQAEDIAGITDSDVRKKLTDAARIGGTIGVGGLEQQYNDELTGTMGTRTVQVDRRNNPIGIASDVPATPGNWLVTSIDAKVQKATEDALAARVEYVKTHPQLSGSERGQLMDPDSGAAVVLDVKTGSIIAMANYPTYDPNVWMQQPRPAEVIDNLPQLNFAIQGQYAPGSTFKIITTAAAVKAGIANFHSQYNCAGQLTVGKKVFRNFDGVGYGMGSLRTALAQSCDTIFFQFGQQMWNKDGGQKPSGPTKDYVVNEALDWGLGTRTGVDLPAEAKGTVQTRQEVTDTYAKYKARCEPKPALTLNVVEQDICLRKGNYRVGDALNTALGQGTTTVTPLQLAAAYAGLANGGTLCTPHLGKAIIKPTGELVKKIEPQCDHKLDITPELRAQIVDALTEVPISGTAKSAFASPTAFPLDQIPVAGKTGTAQVGNKFDTAWFASFAPANDPQYVVVMMISQGGQGGPGSAPGVRSIYDALYGIGQEALLPGSVPPADLPTVAADGEIVPPGSAGQTAAAAAPASALGSSAALSSAKPVAFEAGRSLPALPTYESRYTTVLALAPGRSVPTRGALQ